MDALIADLIKESSATTGTGLNISLSAISGFARYSDAFSVDDVVEYSIRDGNNFEQGLGTIKAGNTLDRTTPVVTFESGVYDSSSPSRINLSGSAVVACAASSRIIYELAEFDLIIPASAETGSLAVTSAAIGFHITRPLTFSEIFAGVNVAPTGAAIEVNVKKNGTTIFSTNLTIDAGETTSLTAATPPVLSSTPTSFVKGDYVVIEIVQVGATEPGEGLKIYCLGDR